jgi:hypothetical protein
MVDSVKLLPIYVLCNGRPRQAPAHYVLSNGRTHQALAHFVLCNGGALQAPAHYVLCNGQPIKLVPIMYYVIVTAIKLPCPSCTT